MSTLPKNDITICFELFGMSHPDYTICFTLAVLVILMVAQAIVSINSSPSGSTGMTASTPPPAPSLLGVWNGTYTATSGPIQVEASLIVLPGADNTFEFVYVQPFSGLTTTGAVFDGELQEILWVWSGTPASSSFLVPTLPTGTPTMNKWYETKGSSNPELIPFYGTLSAGWDEFDYDLKIKLIPA